MNKTQLAFFQQQMSKHIPNVTKNNIVWIYTRVSSKDQFSNRSLAEQKKAAKKYAAEQGYIIPDDGEFGHTYESAKNDFSREEFSRLIDRIKKAKHKPHAILVYIISRFSRTVKSISIVENLVEHYGVHLIETQSGISTETEDGRIRIYEKLLEARKENISRLKSTKPSLIAFLQDGYWLGNVPIGYTRSGKRTKNNYSDEQIIKLNEVGILLKQAWKWKLLGVRDYVIISKLSASGLNISKQKLSGMWRNPFYCGINCNKMLNEPVAGKWEKMVTVDDFMAVQTLTGKFKSGYKQEKEHPDHCLANVILCPVCEQHLLVPYYRKKRNKKDGREYSLAYYKCNYCKGGNCNANTTPRSKDKGVHNYFENLLNYFELKSDDLDILRLQIDKLVSAYFDSSIVDENRLNQDLSKVEDNLKTVRIRWALKEIEKDVYDVAIQNLEMTKNEILVNLNKTGVKLSNQEKEIKKILKFIQNLQQAWVSGSLSIKRTVQKLMFPEGLVIDRKNDCYRTNRINKVFELIASKSVYCEQKIKGLNLKIQNESLVVAGVGLEPTTFGL